MKTRDLDSGIGEGQPLSDEDFANGNTIDISRPEENENLKYSIEHGNGFEGDILLNEEQGRIILNGTEEDLMSLRSAESSKLWPKLGSTVIVPYVITGSYSASERAQIARAFAEYEAKTCIRYNGNLSLLKFCSSSYHFT